MKTFNVEIALNTVGIVVKAKNRTEARKKAYANLRRKNILKLIDRQNTWIDEL